MIIPLLLAAALDMSLPEFQPEDVSGNYIVGSYDVSNDDVVVQYVPTNSLILYSVSDNDSSDVVDAINALRESNDAYWEDFLTSYNANFYTKYTSSFFFGSGTNHFYFRSSGKIGLMDSNTQKLMYVPVKKGRTYTIYDAPTLGATQHYISGFVESLTPVVGSDIIGFQNHSDDYQPNGTTFTSPVTGYFCLYSNTNLNNSVLNFYVLETQTYRDDITVIKEDFNPKLSALVNMLSCAVFVLCFMAFVPFLTKTVDKLMNKKED